jgi:O-acetyl-ADP-ribose deacetylase (regulator of RNase III)
VYGSRAGLEEHLRQQHADSISASQVDAIVKIGETSTVDLREKCPVCLVSADAEGMGDFQNHVANHLERFATFALPNGNEDADGASSAASRGRSESYGSQDASEMSLPSDDEELDEATVQAAVHTTVQDGPLLSADSLRSLPDASGDRLTLLRSSDELQSNDEAESNDEPKSNDEPQLNDETPTDHIERTAAFKDYLLSLGAGPVRFFRRYDWWRGDATFPDEKTAVQALESFDRDRFPGIKLRQGGVDFRNRLKFNGPNPGNSYLQQPANTTDGGDKQEAGNKTPVLTLSEIPTLHDLYRSRKLLQRDQSFAPNDSYNRIISFCYHDLTKLKVDVIVNSANEGLGRSSMPSTLNNVVHDAAGPGLIKEAKSHGSIKTGDAVLTGGHRLPSAHVIHAARPAFDGVQGTTRLETLTKCYHSALELALQHGFKSVAFPCIGTGGVGFSSRVAARLVLQEVREFLDKHPEHPFERIVFVVNSTLDDKAYMDFFAVFFPPTHGDLEAARASVWSADRSTLSAQVFETRAQVQNCVDLATEFNPHVSDQVFSKFRDINACLTVVRSHLMGTKELEISVEDTRLLCEVMQTVCGSINSMTKDVAARHGAVWADYNAQMKATHGVDLVQFLADCNVFAQYLVGITNDKTDGMAVMRQQLNTFKTKQTERSHTERSHDQLDEAHKRTFHTSPQKWDSIQLHQIPSVHHLYQQGQLEEKPTLARPSVLFNNTVCLAREDITSLDVTVIVNSTNNHFSGSGTLDRRVFQKGGAELRQECNNFGTCNEGDVKVTSGYQLPAKHIFHVIRPDQYNKDVLRKMYRNVLYRAASMRATSIAIPSIGTGALNYPRRDCTAVAMEEVKRYLETAEPSSTLESIVFVVYSSHDEFVYKSMLPVYFPPVSAQRGTAVRPTTPDNAEASTPGSTWSEDAEAPTRPPRRSLFGSIGNAVSLSCIVRSKLTSVAS